ncbi:MAG: SDR family oxidoreductase [Chloroflexota bacterium]|nr:SDR family oxidoreductase [Chloroflexota bacterium]
MELGLKEKRALVLAASRGLGYACALGLAHEGCNIAICSRSRDRIEAAAEEIREQTGATVHALVCDVSNEEDVKEMVGAAIDRLGGLEIVVHNAGGPPSGPFGSITQEQWDQAVDQNLMSFVWLVQAAVPAMEEAGYGRILAIASSSIKQPIPNLVLSNTMRTGVLGLAKTLSKELAPHNILVNVIAPGRIATERIDELDRAVAERRGTSVEEIRQASVESIPLGRLGQPKELANMVVFLASEAASYVTGTAIAVDGGKIDALQ